MLNSFPLSHLSLSVLVRLEFHFFRCLLFIKFLLSFFEHSVALFTHPLVFLLDHPLFIGFDLQSFLFPYSILLAHFVLHFVVENFCSLEAVLMLSLEFGFVPSCIMNNELEFLLCVNLPPLKAGRELPEDLGFHFLCMLPLLGDMG